MKEMKKKIKIFWNRDEATVGIIVAVLMVGLILIIFSIVQTIYVPRWMEQREAEHMDKVLDQFSLLKFATDIQILTEQDTPVSTSVELGNKKLPFLESSCSFGFLCISSNLGICITTNDDNSTRFSIGRLIYSSENVYFLDQSFIYEFGAIISSQSEGNVMSMKPSFDVMYSNPEVKLSFDAVNILSIGEKISVSGCGLYPIQTKFSNINISNIYNIKNITLFTNYKNAWSMFINNSFLEQGLIRGADFWIYFTDNGIKIEFASDLDVDITLKHINIIAQIGPGWIE